ncbi:MAG TPA: anti-sigma factor [Chitinophagaceae bacterium]|nr:anti-sigma factor [Chitinophagaceae bacterium]
MTIKEYILSGMVESYVLGLATEAEQHEFEALVKQYPELAQAKLDFELSLETQLMRDSIAPPIAIKEKIIQSLDTSASNISYQETEEFETPVRRMNAWKWIAAASFLLLLGVGYWAFSVNTKYQDLQQANAELKDQLGQSTEKVAELNKTAQTLKNPVLRTATLHGTAHAPGSFANVYWDTTTKDVWLLINNMPDPVSDNQYQLWALLDGKPIDLGVIDSGVWQQKLLVKMKNVQGAEAFAITLEPQGGSASPTMEKMYVSGKL